MSMQLTSFPNHNQRTDFYFIQYKTGSTKYEYNFPLIATFYFTSCKGLTES